MLKIKQDFLVRELQNLTLSSSLQTRNEFFPIYNLEEINLLEAKKLRADTRGFLNEYFEELKARSVSEEEHIQKIKILSRKLTKRYSKILFEKKFRIGISQKIINLFLKYLWTLGLIKMPHHCPIDNIIKLKLQSKFQYFKFEDWTKMNSIQKYLDYIYFIGETAAKEKLTIAEWELINWKRR